MIRHSRFLVFGLLTVLVCFLQTARADIFVVLVGDTLSPTSDAVTEDVARLKRELGVIALHTGQKVLCATLTAEQVKASTIMETVEGLSFQPDDAVIFYFLGHGYRTSVKDGQWPFLYLCSEDRGLDLALVVESFIAKKPRMALVIADCCNNVVDDEQGNPWEPRGEVLVPCGTKKAAGYRTLFNEFQGLVVVCSSTPGEYAYCRPSGHLFTNALLRSLHQEVVSRAPDWRVLIERASVAVHKYQHPCYDILFYP